MTNKKVRTKAVYIIKRLAKNKWQAQYSNGEVKVFKTLKAANAAADIANGVK